MYEARFGGCAEYKCTAYSKLAIVIPFGIEQFEKLVEFLKMMFKNTEKLHRAAEVDLLIYAYDEVSETQRMKEIQRKVTLLKVNQLFGRVEVRSSPELFSSEDQLLRSLLMNETTLKQYCYFQYMSMNTRILRSDWISGLIAHSLNASSQNFWIKGGIDMSYKRDASYEDIRISTYSLYAAHCACLRDLVVYTEEEHPTWKLQRSLNEMIRTPGSSIGFSHMLATKIIPSTISVNFENTEIRFNDARRKFSDAYWIEGAQITS